MSHIVTIDDELPNKEVSNESEKVLVNNFLSSLIDNIHLEYSIISSSLDDVKYFINLFASFFSQMRPIALILGAISKEKVLESGLVIQRKSIALNDVLYMLNFNEFSLERIPGDYSMEDYDHEQYYEEVIQLPTFSDAEYEEFLKARENGKAFDFGNRTCNTSSIKLDNNSSPTIALFG